MKLIVGLGNPGNQYERARHNAGWMVVDRLISRHSPQAAAKSRFHSATVDFSIRSADEPVRALLLKPLTYMNRSGQAVAEAVRFYKVSPAEDLLVIVDDTALPVGSIRLRAVGGAGGHNGLADIHQKLGTDQYARLRVGVGEPGALPQRDYVLGRFSPEQWSAVGPALDRAADAAELWAAQSVVAAMNRFNTPPDKPKRRPEQASGPDSRTHSTNEPETNDAVRPDHRHEDPS